MTIAEPRKPAIGTQVRRWRAERGLTLAGVSERTGLNVGYLSQIENDKAQPSLSCLSSIAAALEVPIAWFFIDEAPAPQIVRRSERSVREVEAWPNRARRRRHGARHLDSGGHGAAGVAHRRPCPRRG